MEDKLSIGSRTRSLISRFRGAILVGATLLLGNGVVWNCMRIDLDKRQLELKEYVDLREVKQQHRRLRETADRYHDNYFQAKIAYRHEPSAATLGALVVAESLYTQTAREFDLEETELSRILEREPQLHVDTSDTPPPGRVGSLRTVVTGEREHRTVRLRLGRPYTDKRTGLTINAFREGDRIAVYFAHQVHSFSQPLRLSESIRGFFPAVQLGDKRVFIGLESSSEDSVALEMQIPLGEEGDEEAGFTKK